MARRFLRIVELLLIAAVSLSGSSAQAGESGHGISYWVVQKGETTLWIVGELHNQPLGISQLPNELRAIVQSSDAVGFEVLSLPSRNNLGAFTDYRGRLLTDQVSGELWRRLGAEVTRSPAPGGGRIGLDRFNRLNPVWASVWIDLITRERHLSREDRAALPTPAAAALGWSYAVRGAAGHRPQLGLDTEREFLGAWDRCAAEGLTESLLQLSLTAWKEDRYRDLVLRELKSRVMEGDAEGVVASMKSHPLTRLIYDCTVVERNKRWFGRISDHSKKFNRILYVVGASHLGGSQGLLALLQSSGYSVSRRHTIW